MKNKFKTAFKDDYVCDGDTIRAGIDGFDIVARIVRDNSPGTPAERDDGFWPSRDPKDAGWIGENPKESFEVQQARAESVMMAWENDAWFYCGVVLSVSRPIMIDGCTQTEVVISDHAASLWGVECNCSARKNEYLTEVANELLDEALEHARECLRQIKREQVVIEVSGGVAECTSAPDSVDVVIIDHDA